MELTLDPSLPRELPQAPGQKAVPPGGRDPLNEENGTLPMDGTREVEDSAGLFLPGDLEHKFVAKKRKTQSSKTKLASASHCRCQE
jgi:hypothetical protein